MIRAVLAFAWLTYRNLHTGRRIVAAALLAFLPPAAALVIAAFGRKTDGTQLFHGIAFEYTLWLMVYLLGLIFGLGLTWGEIEEGTVGYIYLGALPKWMIVLVQAAVTTAVLAALIGLSLLLTGLACTLAPRGAPERLWRDVGAFTLLGGIGVLAALSFTMACGLAFRAPLAVAAIATFFWEFLTTLIPARFAAWTVTNNLRALMADLVFDGARPHWYAYVRNYDLPTYGEAALFLSVVVAAFLVAAMVAVMNRSVEGKEAR